MIERFDMKRFKLVLAIAAALVLTTSCAVTKYASEVPASQVTSIALLQPLSYIDYFDNNHNMTRNDTLCTASSAMVAKVAGEFLPIDCVIPVNYTEEMAAEVDVLPGLDPKTLMSATIPEATRELILGSGHRYGAVVFARGFTRERGGYASDIAKGVILGIATAVLTMGMVSAYGIPEKCESQISLMIVDAEANRVIYYDRSLTNELEPLKENSIRSQLKSVLKGFK